MSQAGRRVAVVGLDGADFDIIGRLIEDGRMPCLRSLMERGAWCKMRSVVPPVSSAAWTSMCSGVNPGRHGILGFARPVEGTYKSEIIRATHIRVPQLWDMLRQVGKRSIVTNLPNIYPPVDVNGVMVSGLLTPDVNSCWCHPRELQAELVGKGLGFRPGPSVRQLRKMDNARALQTLNARPQMQADTIRHLIAREDWDLLFCVLDSGDVTQHTYLGPAHAESRRDDVGVLETPSGEVIADHFVELDRVTGDILASLPDDTTVFIVSDHGFCPKPKVVYLNQWLENLGYLRMSRFVSAGADPTNWRTRTIAELLGKLHLGFLSRLVPERTRQREVSVPRLGRMLGCRKTVWAHTKAFLDPTALGSGLRINLRGREREGIVEPGDEYEALRDDLMQRLSELRNPDTDEPVIDQVWRREDLHPGDHNAHEPDVIMTFQEGWRAAHTHPGHVFGDAEPGGASWHSQDGILIAAGPGILPRGEMELVSLLDIAPSVLTLLGISPPSYMEGERLACLDAELDLIAREIHIDVDETHDDGLTAEEEATVSARLEDLGYL